MLKRGLFLWLIAWSCGGGVAADARIIKVLPHYLDREGRHALSPSLYERDAYQHYLRKRPNERSALRFDVQWKARGNRSADLVLRLELRTSQSGADKPIVLDQPVNRARWFGNWSALSLRGEAYRNMGDLIAWRATLRDGERQIAELTSFLW